MIKSFRHAGLQSFFETGSKAGIRPEHASRLNRILGILDAATLIEQAHLGISRPHLSKVLNNGRASITAEMDLKLSEALGQPPGLWIRMQATYDLWQAEQQPRQKVAPLNAAVLNS